MHRRHRRPRTALVVAVAATLLAGCGSGDDPTGSGPAGASGSSGASLTHVDGTLALSGETLTVTPSSGGAAIVMTLGPDVERGALQSVVAAGGTARVLYVDDDAPIAAKVEAAPDVDPAAKTYTGAVTKVTVGTLTIDGPDGERTFEVGAADREAFDLEHLEDHRDSGERVKVYYRAADGTDTALAYEDA